MGTPLTQWHEILETLSYHMDGEKPKSLSQLVLKQYRVVTPGQTDGQNYHS